MKITQNVRDYANNLTNSDSEVEEGLKAMKEVYQEQGQNCIIKCKYSKNTCLAMILG